MAIYKDFNIQPENSLVSGDVVTNVKDTVSSGMWADGDGSMTTFFTSSTQSSSFSEITDTQSPNWDDVAA